MFIENENLNIEGNLYLGGNVKFTSLFSSAPSAVTITIEDSGGATKIDEVAMTVVDDTSSRVWEYIYQSAETDYAGLYAVFIRATSGVHISFLADKFEVLDGDLINFRGY